MKTDVNTAYGTLELSGSGHFTSLLSDSQADYLDKIKRRALSAFEQFDSNPGRSLPHPAPRIYHVDGRFLYYRLKGTEAVRIERNRERNELIFAGGLSSERGSEGKQKTFVLPIDPTKPHGDAVPPLEWKRDKSSGHWQGLLAGELAFVAKSVGKEWLLVDMKEETSKHKTYKACREAAWNELIAEAEISKQEPKKAAKSPIVWEKQAAGVYRGVIEETREIVYINHGQSQWSHNLDNSATFKTLKAAKEDVEARR